jgi:hypothetical protein
MEPGDVVLKLERAINSHTPTAIVGLLTADSVFVDSMRARVQVSRSCAHAADVPVLLSAIARKPDWLLTHSTKHFTKAVAETTALRIATPAEFFRTLSALFR